MRIGLPRRLIILVRLLAPIGPVLPRAAREEFEIRRLRARFDDRILLIGLAESFANGEFVREGISSLNKQWRICFEWPKGAGGPSNVEIVDYH
jgi:hypothetical protein